MSLHAIVHVHGLLVHGVVPVFRAGRHGGRFRLDQLQDVATIGALALVPLAFWVVKLRTDRWEESRRREDARAFAIDVAVTLAKSIQLCESVRAAIQAGGRVSDDTVEAAIESLDLSRRRLRTYLRRHIPLHELIPLAAAAEKQLGDGFQAMRTLQDARDGADQEITYARQLQTVRTELQAVAERLRGLQPDLSRAIAKVDAGWAPSD